MKPLPPVTRQRTPLPRAHWAADAVAVEPRAGRDRLLATHDAQPLHLRALADHRALPDDRVLHRGAVAHGDAREKDRVADRCFAVDAGTGTDHRTLDGRAGG